MSKVLKFLERPYWRPTYSETISQLLNIIPQQYETVKKFIDDPINQDYVEGYCELHRAMYLTVSNRGEKNGTQSIEATDKALKLDPLFENVLNRTEKKTRNLSSAMTHLFGDCLIRSVGGHTFAPQLAKEVNEIIGDGLFPCGKYRTVLLQPSGYSFMYMKPEEIEFNMIKLFEEVNSLEKTNRKEWYEIVSYFLERFLLIHPFKNGNGRTVRLLISTLLIKRFAVPVPLYGENEDHGVSVYLKCIHEAQIGNFLPLNSLIIESIHRTLHMFIQILEAHENII